MPADGLSLELTRLFSAPRARLFEFFAEAALLAEWWGPRGFSIPSIDFVPRVGIERLREVIVNDSLGLNAALDAEVEKTMAAYVDPWLERDQPAYAGQFEDVKKVPLPMA